MEKIKFDERNYRKHDEKNKKLINKSIKELGAGRSILLDSENSIIAGNGVYEQAKLLNLPIKIIETKGEELIAVKRIDLKTNDIRRMKLAVMDNSTSDTSTFDIGLLQEDFEIKELSEMGIVLQSLEDSEIEMPELNSGDKEPFQQMTFTLADEQAEELKEALSEIKKGEIYKNMDRFGNENSNGNALYALLLEWKNG